MLSCMTSHAKWLHSHPYTSSNTPPNGSTHTTTPPPTHTSKWLHSRHYTSSNTHLQMAPLTPLHLLQHTPLQMAPKQGRREYGYHTHRHLQSDFHPTPVHSVLQSLALKPCPPSPPTHTSHTHFSPRTTHLSNPGASLQHGPGHHSALTLYREAMINSKHKRTWRRDQWREDVKSTQHALQTLHGNKPFAISTYTHVHIQ